MSGPGTNAMLRVEVVYALPARQLLVPLEVEAGTTVQQAIDRSAIADSFPGENLTVCAVGVWGHPVGRAHPVRDGDRIELYRELLIDPRRARRKLARAGKTMGRS
jgi:putative ubiquitin-RnfH superfamily antitoxin RatB of RatAB toxin-antitoxin module